MAAQGARQGITLFEVVLALAIFLGALAAISQVLRTGSKSLLSAQFTSDAALRAEDRMNQLLGGVLELSSQSRTPFDDDPNWVSTVNILDSGTVNLLKVEVIVEHLHPSGRADVRLTLSRLVRDPQIYLDANAASAEATL